MYRGHFAVSLLMLCSKAYLRHPSTVSRNLFAGTLLRVIAKRRRHLPCRQACLVIHIPSRLYAISDGQAVRYTLRLAKSSAVSAASATRFISGVPAGSPISLSGGEESRASLAAISGCGRLPLRNIRQSQ